MKMTAPARPGLTVGQMMKVVVLWSGACAAMAPFAILWRMGMTSTGGLLLIAAFVMPLALACLSFLLVRPGAWKDRLILIELLVSVATGLGIASFVAYSMAGHLLLALKNTGASPPILREGVLVALAIVALTSAFVFLMKRLVHTWPRGAGASRPIDGDVAGSARISREGHDEI